MQISIQTANEHEWHSKKTKSRHAPVHLVCEYNLGPPRPTPTETSKTQLAWTHRQSHNHHNNVVRIEKPTTLRWTPPDSMGDQKCHGKVSNTGEQNEQNPHACTWCHHDQLKTINVRLCNIPWKWHIWQEPKKVRQSKQKLQITNNDERSKKTNKIKTPWTKPAMPPRPRLTA